jgi:hypothetical protein
MKTKTMICRLTSIFILSLLFTTSVFADQAPDRSRKSSGKISNRSAGLSAEIAPSSIIRISTLIKELNKKQKNSKLNPKESDLLFLLHFSQEIGAVKTITFYGVLKRQYISQVRNQTIIQSFEKEVSKKNKTLSKKETLNIVKNKDRIKRIFGAKSFSWGWILSQLNEHKSAKIILSELFSTDYDRLMAQSMAHFGMSRSPLERINRTFNTLYPLCDTEDKKVLTEKLRKVKVHLSNLPQSNIRT